MNGDAEEPVAPAEVPLTPETPQPEAAQPESVRSEAAQPEIAPVQPEASVPQSADDAQAAPAEGADGTPPENVAPIPVAKPKEVKIPLPSSLQEIVGSLLFASPSPLTATDLRTTIRSVEPQEGEDASVMEIYRTCTNREIEEALHGLEKELDRSGVGFHLVCTGGQYRLQTNAPCGRYVRALLHLDKPGRLGRASLETLAIVAYRQPITKSEIEQIRGVAVDTIIKTLVDLQLVRLVGKSELPGHPFLYGTTPQFLEHFGLASLGELNAIDPTLQRSNPRERAKLFQKKEKPAEDANQPELPTQTEGKPHEEETPAPVQDAPAAAGADAGDGVHEAADAE